MSSINTNAGAMTALQTLKATNKNLETTQGRISTGARVNEAAHNAAYWSIATTMRSDNNAMSTVKDALGLGAAQVDIAYTAMDAVKDTLDTMKSKLVAAQQPDIDKEKIQEEINQLQNDLKTYAKSATFSGGNWLDVDGAETQQVVASFIRSEDGSISLATIDVDTAKTALFNSKTGEPGLLQAGKALAATGGIDDDSRTGGAGTAATTALTYAALTLDEDDAITFNIAINDGAATSVRIDHRVVSSALGSSDGAIANAAAWAKVLSTALTNAGVDVGATGDVTVDGTTGHISTVATGTEAKIAISGTKSSDNGNFFNAIDVNISSASDAQLKEYMQGIDTMLSKVTTAASDLGAIKTRIASQSDFVGKIMDAVDRGVGQLVDADMEQESSRLQALQVQQQLGIQALSIANSNTQNILSLFR